MLNTDIFSALLSKSGNGSNNISNMLSLLLPLLTGAQGSKSDILNMLSSLNPSLSQMGNLFNNSAVNVPQNNSFPPLFGNNIDNISQQKQENSQNSSDNSNIYSYELQYNHPENVTEMAKLNKKMKNS